jgi:hypothetical protein
MAASGFGAPAPGAPLDDQAALQPQEKPVFETVELICPNCGAACLADPAAFPDGRTVAACSACQGTLCLTKD